jgi:hypothetical protein
MASADIKPMDQVEVSRNSDDDEKAPTLEADWTPEEERKAKWKSVSSTSS